MVPWNCHADQLQRPRSHTAEEPGEQALYSAKELNKIGEVW